MLNMAEGLARIGALAASPVVATLADAFAAAGHELAIVGWPVRDALLGRRTNDLDFTTDARPDEILRIVEPIATATWDIGRAFGTIGAKIRGEQVEITTYRADSYDGVTRKPTVEFGDTLEGDLARRDFTVNAMALRVPGPALVDPTGGVEDLVAGVLRTPSDPAVSFGDDPLRMLRAARFASQLGFDPAPATVAAIERLGETLRIVSPERVQGELVKLLQTDDPTRGIRILVDTAAVFVVDVLRAHERRRHEVVAVDAREPQVDQALRRQCRQRTVGDRRGRRLPEEQQPREHGERVVARRQCRQRRTDQPAPDRVVGHRTPRRPHRRSRVPGRIEVGAQRGAQGLGGRRVGVHGSIQPAHPTRARNRASCGRSLRFRSARRLRIALSCGPGSHRNRIPMTLTSPVTGPRPAPRLRRRVWSGVLAALLVLGAAPVAAVAAVTGPPEAPPMTFTAAPESDALWNPDQPLQVAVQAANPTDSTVAAGQVSVSLGDSTLADADDVAAWIAEGTDAGELVEAAQTLLPSIAAHGELDVTVDIDASTAEDRAPGVYPLLVTYASAQGELTARSVVVVPDADASPQVAIVVPITAGPLTTGLATAEQLEALTADDGALRARLDAVTGTAAILAVDPAIPAAIRALGSAAPESATDWLDDLLALPNTRFALQFGDADIATQLSASAGTLLTATTLSPYLDAENFTAAVEETPTADAADVDDTETGALPDDEALLEIGPSRDGVYWPASGSAGSETITGIRRADDTAVTLVPSSVTGATGAVAGRGETDDGAALLVADSRVSTALSNAVTIADSVDRAAALAQVTAYTSLATAQLDDAPLLVVVDRAASADRSALQSALSAVTGVPGTSTVDLNELLASTPTRVQLVEIEPDTGRADVLNQFRTDESELTSFATILEDPQLITATERAEILQLIGNGWRETPVAWRDAVTAHRTQTRTTLDAVSIVPPAGITLLGSSAPLQFSIRNDLAWPVSLVLIASPNDPRLRVQNTTTVEAGPLQNTRADVPVEARVGSGEATIDLQLRSPSMVAIGDTLTADVSVRAEWETVGIVVMGIVVGGLIVLGAVRTWLRLRARGGPRDEDVVAHEKDADNG